MRIPASRALTTLTLALAALAALSAATALAQPEPADQPMQPPNDQPLLAGPQVRDSAADTLVQRDMQGRFQRLDARPEEAALTRMVLDPEQRERARAVIGDRAASLRRHLVDNIDLIRESTDAIRAGDQATARRLARDLYDSFDPAHERDPLLAPLAAVLSPDEHTELTRLVDEYWDSWIDAELRASPGQPREQVRDRLILEQFQSELTTAYRYTLQPFQQKLDAIYAAVEPTPEQRAAIRAAVIEYIRDGRLQPTADQRAILARTIYQALDEPRRIKLLAAALAAL